MKITVATYNIQFGRGLDMRFDLDRTAREVAGADIVGFQEVTQNWQRTGGEDQAAGLARRLGFHYVYGYGLDVAATPVAGASGPDNRRRTFGNMVASRWPIRSSRTFLLPKTALATIYDMQRCLVEAVVETPVGDVRIYSTHLSHISPGQRLPQIELILRTVADAPANGSAWDGTHTADWTEGWDVPALPEPALVLGDMNFDYRTPEYAAICGEMDAINGRVVRATALRDAWVAAGHREEDGVSIRSDYSGHVRIDHMFVTPSVARHVRSMRIDDDAKASDHYPVFLELDVPEGGFGR
ncbi:endonuclease/exonuclease/phosphatase family metal-dependent hydrolase [Stella humosa]|uniref:Endonuclease/exonuclease/phosphatase family metal-dependent hydrolase n=1 Tax=Stella humosa TaxID=94 RepID=A0A3N1KN56_9PROT|nr:endonuclease/exonuclease/phosphatase family protein [Stella humosa]ROP83163.1 endonuclease/exonuclease/phosphatase family metal-dependent hydrolase [Stella humosa]BBK30060.1 endonuclease/exonuclease/phosphatase [Stella humosa]